MGTWWWSIRVAIVGGGTIQGAEYADDLALQRIHEVDGSVPGHDAPAESVTTVFTQGLSVAVSGLPAQPVFEGREDELEQLAGALKPAVNGTVTAIAGLAGVGKTALAVRAARAAEKAGWFSGGVVMVDMHGYAPPERQTSASAVLFSLLSALGIASEQIPPDQQGLERLWRSVLADRASMGKRILLLVDNASHGDQVRSLLPGETSADFHRVLVTSRHSLATLQGARLMDLDLLPDEQAMTLLAVDLAAACRDDNRIHDDPAAALQVARLCSGLPLAVRICSALLAAHPNRSVAELVEPLADERERLEELDFDGSLAVRAAFDLSYERLTSDQARVFRLLAVNPGPSVSTKAMAAVTELTISEVRRIIRQLSSAHLVVPAESRDRWRMHDLLRLYANEHNANDPNYEGAIRRLLGYYLTAGRTANRHLDPRRPMRDQDQRFTDREHALRWLDNERPCLVRAVTLATSMDFHTLTCELSAALYYYLELRKLRNDWIHIATCALKASRNLGNRHQESSALAQLGTALQEAGSVEQALTCHEQSLEICRALNDRPSEGRCLTNLGNAYLALGRVDEAVAHNTKSLQIRRDLNDRYGQRITLTHLGNAYQQAGRISDAVTCYEESLGIHRETGDWNGEGRTLTNLGNAYRASGRLQDAVDCYQRDLVISRDLQDRHAEAITLANLGNVHRDLAQWDKAADCYRLSLDLRHNLGDRDGEHSMQTKLDDLNQIDLLPRPTDDIGQINDHDTEPIYCTTECIHHES